MAKVEHKESPMKTECSLSLLLTLSFCSLCLCLSVALSAGRPCVPLRSLSEQTEMRVEEWGTHMYQRGEDERVQNKGKSNTRHEGNTRELFLSAHTFFHRELYHFNALKRCYTTTQHTNTPECQLLERN